MTEISGTAVVDNSDFVSKQLQNARRTRTKEDWTEVERYYNRVEDDDPHIIEAIFYSAYAKAMLSLVKSDKYSRAAEFKVLTKALSILDDEYVPRKDESVLDIMSQITKPVCGIMESSFVYNYTKKIVSGEVTDSDKNDTYMLFIGLGDAYANTLQNIINKEKICVLLPTFARR